jgi:hypothetical protein
MVQKGVFKKNEVKLILQLIVLERKRKYDN